MSTGRGDMASATSGTQTSALAAGGYTTTRVATTEEFNGETVAANVKTITTS